jgi:hypothetical protein
MHFCQVKVFHKYYKFSDMPTYYGRGDHRFKIKLRQQRTDGKFYFLNITIVDWDQLPAAVFEGSPMNLCKFRRNLRKL